MDSKRSGQLKWSVLFIGINVYHVIGLPLPPSGQQVSPLSPANATVDFNLSLLTLVVIKVNEVKQIGQQLYKRWEVINCPNLEVAVYGDCFIKSQVTLIAAAAAGSSLFVVLLCFLCRRRRHKEKVYQQYLSVVDGQRLGNGHKGEPRLDTWSWFSERKKRKRKEREERWIREREKEIERRRRKEKKAKAKG